MEMRSVVLCLGLALAPVAGWSQGDPITGFAADDVNMNTAMETARTTLPRFLGAITDGEGYGAESAALKVAFDTGDSGLEIIWVAPFQWDGNDAFRGLLANQPNFMAGLNAGDMVTFDQSMVRDWSWSDASGQLWGNYTTRVMIPQLSARDQEQLSAALSPTPVPQDW